MRGRASQLTDAQRREIWRLIELRVRLTDKAIARQLGVPETAVRYAARKFRQREASEA